MRSADSLALKVALAALVVAVSGIALALVGTTHRAKAEADRWLLDLGARAMAFPGASLEEPRLARLNGIQLSFKTQALGASLDDVIEHFRNACIERASSSSPLAQVLSAFATRTAANDNHGYVACLSLGVADLPSLAVRVKRFSETGDLADLGALRYAYAQRSRSGTPATLLFTVWSDASLPLGSLIARDGSDSPGEDLPGVPRPRGATRVLSFHESSGPSRIAVYRSRLDRAAAARGYREQLVADQWVPIGGEGARPIELDHGLIVAAESESRMLTALVDSDSGSGTLVTLLLSEAR